MKIVDCCAYPYELEIGDIVTTNINHINDEGYRIVSLSEEGFFVAKYPNSEVLIRRYLAFYVNGKIIPTHRITSITPPFRLMGGRFILPKFR